MTKSVPTPKKKKEEILPTNSLPRSSVRKFSPRLASTCFLRALIPRSTCSPTVHPGGQIRIDRYRFAFVTPPLFSLASDRAEGIRRRRRGKEGTGRAGVRGGVKHTRVPWSTGHRAVHSDVRSNMQLDGFPGWLFYFYTGTQRGRCLFHLGRRSGIWVSTYTENAQR